MAVDWRLPYRCSWRVFRVNTETWADAGTVSGVTSVSVERCRKDDDPLLEKGTLSVDSASGQPFEEGYYRVAMTATQSGDSERVDVCTLYCHSASGEVNRGVDVLDVSGHSVLWPASKAMLEPGSYAPRGVDGAQWCASVLRASVNAPVEVVGSFTLDDHLVFDGGTYALDAVWQVLDAGGFVIQIGGDGTVRVMPMPTEPDLDLSQANARLLHPGVRHELDFSEVPNRYEAVEGSVRAVAVNDDTASPTSTVSRGWASDVYDSAPKRVNGETLQAYAERMLEERSMVPDSRTYTREYWPSVLPYSVVRGAIASVGLDGDMRVASQRLTCDIGITIEEDSEREVRTWQRAS